MSINYILSQLFVIFHYVMLGATYLITSRKKILIFSLISLLLNGVSFIFLSAWSGLATVGIAVTRNIIFLIQNKNRKVDEQNTITWVDWLILIVLFVISIILAIFTYNGIFSLLSVIATMVYTVSVWHKDVKVYGILGVVASALWIGYYVFINSIFAVLLESVVLVVEIISVIKNYKNKKLKLTGDSYGKS